ncbi:unnamed protein product [Ceratitis capitata]|uniref:(Mediterranean fruit fly) hypothetical protein n=1 Tax=Ceratitis capitata TaxID=7213 RepID=A0A811U7H4_CERCA|nr:unnamed protein product [Ceratitis capitata]
MSLTLTLTVMLTTIVALTDLQRQHEARRHVNVAKSLFMVFNKCNNSRIPKVTNKTRALENNNNNNNEKAVQRKQTLTTALTTNTTTINNKWAATMQIPNENDVIAALIQKPPNSCFEKTQKNQGDCEPTYAEALKTARVTLVLGVSKVKLVDIQDSIMVLNGLKKPLAFTVVMISPGQLIADSKDNSTAKQITKTATNLSDWSVVKLTTVAGEDIHPTHNFTVLDNGKLTL